MELNVSLNQRGRRKKYLKIDRASGQLKRRGVVRKSKSVVVHVNRFSSGRRRIVKPLFLSHSPWTQTNTAATAAPTIPATPYWILVATAPFGVLEVEDAFVALKHELVTEYLSRGERTKTQMRQYWRPCSQPVTRRSRRGSSQLTPQDRCWPWWWAR